MKPFQYYAPTTLAEACRILGDCEGARALAGGTDLLIRMKRGQWLAPALVNLKCLPELRGISQEAGGELRLGALVTLNEIIRSPLVRTHFAVLAHTASAMAGVQVRNLATLGGNLCNASPAADMAPPLIALNARAVIVGTQGERVLPLGAFFNGPGQSALAPGEVLREILVPPLAAHQRASYAKLEHRAAMDIAIVGVAVGVTFQNGRPDSRRAADVRIVLGAAAPTPLRARQAEEMLRGQALTEERIREVARAAAAEAQPIDDVRGSAWYRRAMIEVLTRRQLLELGKTQ